MIERIWPKVTFYIPFWPQGYSQRDRKKEKREIIKKITKKKKKEFGLF